MKKWATELNRAFTRKTFKWLKKPHINKCSSLQAIKEMQIKTTLRFYLILARMDIKNTNNNKCWQGHGEKGTLIHC
jgi:hypothetical protein